jgi:ubiquinone biosynthesis protein
MLKTPASKPTAAPKRQRKNPAFKWLGLNRGVHQANRLRQILTVLTRYGFGELAVRLDLRSTFRLRGLATMKKTEDAQLDRGQRLVRALEELGPTFIKLGQVLSTRPDILAPDFIAALSELQDRVPGFPVSEVRRIIEEDLHAPLEQVFPEFNPEPIAAASLSQVHRARLPTGEDVAVKVQRPHITETIENDLAILETVARLIEQRLPQYAVYDPQAIVREFAKSLRHELDFVREAQNAAICRHNFRRDPNVVIPRVFEQCSSRRVLAIEYLDGVKVNDFPALEQQGIDRHELAVAGCIIYMKMIFDHGFYQADPHPGNLVVLPDGLIGILDFGMFMRIAEEDRHRIVDFMLAAFDRRADLIVRLMLDSGQTTEKIDEPALRTDIMDLLDRYYGVELKSIPLGPLIRELLAIQHLYNIRMPAGTTMLMRGLGTVEGLGLVIDPEFNFVEQMAPFIRKQSRERMSVGGLFKTARHYRSEIEILLHHLPEDLRGVLDRIKKGQIELVLNPDEFRKIGTSLERSNDRLSVAIVLAAIIVGASLLVFAAPTVFRGFVPVIGVVGFVAAAILGVWLFISTLRRGRF